MGSLTDSYRQLGIVINGGEARTAWSAVSESERIVAITIWTDEIRRDPDTGIYFLDTRELEEGRRGAWRKRTGHKNRLRHLQHAMNWGGTVRVVKVQPQLGESPEERHAQMTHSAPWLYKGRPIEADVVFFDGEDFRVEIDPKKILT